MQEKLFQRCVHLLYCSVLSLGGNVNTRRMSLHIKKLMKYSGHRKLLCELSKLSNFNAFNHPRILNEHYSCLQIPPTGFNMYAEYTQLQLTFLEL